MAGRVFVFRFAAARKLILLSQQFLPSRVQGQTAVFFVRKGTHARALAARQRGARGGVAVVTVAAPGMVVVINGGRCRGDAVVKEMVVLQPWRRLVVVARSEAGLSRGRQQGRPLPQHLVGGASWLRGQKVAITTTTTARTSTCCSCRRFVQLSRHRLLQTQAVNRVSLALNTAISTTAATTVARAGLRRGRCCSCCRGADAEGVWPDDGCVHPLLTDGRGVRGGEETERVFADDCHGASARTKHVRRQPPCCAVIVRRAPCGGSDGGGGIGRSPGGPGVSREGRGGGGGGGGGERDSDFGRAGLLSSRDGGRRRGSQVLQQL